MVLSIIIALAVYFLASFLFAAAIVRLFEKSWAAKAVRKNLLLFPFVPALAFGPVLRQLTKILLRTSLTALRRSFEKLSGQKTYRRRRVRLYKV